MSNVGIFVTDLGPLVSLSIYFMRKPHGTISLLADLNALFSQGDGIDVAEVDIIQFIVQMDATALRVTFPLKQCFISLETGKILVGRKLIF